jgi:hypothetical protein
MSYSNNTSKINIQQRALEQEMTYIPIDEQQELIKKLVHLSNHQAVIIPWKFWRNIRLSL